MSTKLCVGGILPFTTIDYPEHLAAVIFCQGCPWKCPYCHNPHLQSHVPEKRLFMEWEEVMQFLKKRQGLLEGVVFSGGEPTIQPKLFDAMQDVKALGFKVGIHTSGCSPRHLKVLLPHVDWVGMDVKAPFEKYEAITKVSQSGENAKHSIRLILEGIVSHEFRTTMHFSLLSREDLLEIAKTLSSMGAKNFALQRFQPRGCQDEELISKMSSNSIDSKLQKELSALFETFIVR